MSKPDEFPRTGTWSVNQKPLSKFLFITQAHGDGTNSTINLDFYFHKIGMLGERTETSPEFKALLGQICLRHNEALRGEEG